ncbi:ferritin-like metal-binding protein YciE [Rhizobium giardinii]|uniref:Ferritin-like metal-binding protein YciE n=2 Tax=Rhizobium giardinii TaxID=56731 RepID=A0A7W8UBK3_9HYPH|nr:DUF892 family protein [Rhizobium giardinii]MBB5536369.1 ferritin-like metal-binding protein YciE [Rhizobium giardinii]
MAAFFSVLFGLSRRNRDASSASDPANKFAAVNVHKHCALLPAAAAPGDTWNISYDVSFSPLPTKGVTAMSTSARDNLIVWLRDAHAMEQQAETMLNAQYERIETYTALKERIGRHIEETKQQAILLQGCLDRLGEGSSTRKDVAGKLTAMAQGLGGLFASDEVVKGSLAGYTFEHMEIASYRILVAAADYVGDRETVSVCQPILDEEIAMAKWLEDNIGSVTQEFLRRDERDETLATAALRWPMMERASLRHSAGFVR